MAEKTYDETQKWLSQYKRLTSGTSRPAGKPVTQVPRAKARPRSRTTILQRGGPLAPLVASSPDSLYAKVADASDRRIRASSALRGMSSGAIDYFDQYSGNPKVAADVKARLDARRRWVAGERYTPSTRDQRFQTGDGTTVIGGDGFSYRAVHAQRAQGKGAPSVTFGLGGDQATTTSIGDAMATAKRIGDNNQRRERLIGMLTKLGAGKEDLAELRKVHGGLQGLAISDIERGAVSKFLQGARQKVSDEFWSNRRNIQVGRAELRKSGLMSRTDVVARLLGDRRKLKDTSSGFGGRVEDDMYSDMLAAAGGAAATVGAGLRGRRTSTGGSAAMAFNATDKTTGGGIVSSGNLRARFTGGGGGYLSALGGGSGSSANNPAVAFRSMLKSAVGEDPGGRVVGFTPQGDPIFTADRRGGYDHTSFEQNQYKRAAADFKSDVDRMVSDSIISGGAGAQWFSNRRIMKALDRVNYANDTRYVRALDAMTEVARMAGLKPGEFGFQSVPEAPVQQVATLQPQGVQQEENRKNRQNQQSQQFIEDTDPGE